jgi:hypothetical protein
MPPLYGGLRRLSQDRAADYSGTDDLRLARLGITSRHRTGAMIRGGI